MQQIGSNIMNGLKEIGKNFMPNSFTEISDTTQSSDFSNAIENSIQNLKGNNKNNKPNSLNLYVKQALHAIEKNTKQIKQSLKPSEESKIDTENLQEFAVLNIVNNIIDNISSIKTPEELANKLKEKGISEDNVNLIFTQLGLSEHTPYTSQKTNSEEMTFSTLNKSNNQNQSSILNVKNMQKSSDLMDKITFGEKISNENDHISKQNNEILNNNLPKNNLEYKTLDNLTDNSNIIKNNSDFQKLLDQFSSNQKDNELKLTNEEKSLIQNHQNFSKNNKNNNHNTENKLHDKIGNNFINDNSKISIEQSSNILQEKDSSKNVLLNESKNDNKKIKSLNKISKKQKTEKFSETQDLLISKNKIKEQDFKEGILTNEVRPENNTNNNSNYNTKIDTVAINNDILTKNTSFENFINEKTNIQSPNTNLDIYKIAQEANVHSQINIAIKQFKSGDSRQIKLKLHPEELGNVNIELDVSNNSTKGIISVESPELAKHLAQNLKEVFQGFKNAGFEINDKNFEIKVDDQQSQQKQYDQKQNQAENEKQNSNSKEKSFNYTLQEDSLDIKV